jgi:hypothetical protein
MAWGGDAMNAWNLTHSWAGRLLFELIFLPVGAFEEAAQKLYNKKPKIMAVRL